MEFIRIDQNWLSDLQLLQIAYKQEIGEDEPTEADFESLAQAIQNGAIFFYGCIVEEGLIGCCSISPTYSTFNYQKSGVFEDFYILPAFRHKGIARKLVSYAYKQSGVGSLTVGCADCDVEMYQSLGFGIPIGNLFAYEG